MNLHRVLAELRATGTVQEFVKLLGDDLPWSPVVVEVGEYDSRGATGVYMIPQSEAAAERGRQKNYVDDRAALHALWRNGTRELHGRDTRDMLDGMDKAERERRSKWIQRVRAVGVHVKHLECWRDSCLTCDDCGEKVYEFSEPPPPCPECQGVLR